MAFLYEMHLHTCQGSACGRSTGAEHARFYKDAGYQGIFVTDHFFGGNTAVPRDLPWEERIHRFCKGYEDAKAEGDRIGLDVFFGWEQNFAGDEYLIYGLDKQFLLDHPEMEHWTRRQQWEEVHRCGGCVIQAHPFRDRAYIAKVLLARQYCDGIEVANAINHAQNDVCAWRYAKEYDLPVTVGSDNHYHKWAIDNQNELCALQLDQPLKNAKELVQKILNHEKMGIHFPSWHLEAAVDAPQKPAFWLDDREQPYPTNRNWLAEES